MTLAAVRFLFAADVDPDRPLAIGDPIPSRFDDRLETAACQAIDHLRIACLQHRPQFVLLATADFDPATRSIPGQRVLLALLDQLAGAGIEVFLLTSTEATAAAWQALPANLNVLGPGNDGPIPVRHEEAVIAVIGQVVGGTDASLESSTPVARIGYSVGPPDATAGRYDFVALSAPASRQTFRQGRRVMHAPGPLQPFGLEDLGPHGATLVEIDHVGPPKLTCVPTATVLRTRHQVSLATDGDDDTWEGQATQLAGQLQQFLETSLAELTTDHETLCLCEWNFPAPSFTSTVDREQLEKLVGSLQPPDQPGSRSCLHHVRITRQLVQPTRPGVTGSFSHEFFEKLAATGIGDTSRLSRAFTSALPANDGESGWHPEADAQRVLDESLRLACQWWHDSSTERAA